MSKFTPTARLSPNELIRLIANETGLRPEQVKIVYDSFMRMMKRCIVKGAVFPLRGIGQIEYTLIDPKPEQMAYNPYYKEYRMQEAKKGHRKPKLTLFDKFSTEVREVTAWE